MRSELRITILPALAGVLLLGSASFAGDDPASRPAFAGPRYATAKGGKLLGLADPASTPLRDLKVGEPLIAVAKHDQLWEVEVPGGITAWVWAAYTRDGKETGTVETIENAVNLRPSPTREARAVPIARASKGTLLMTVGREGDWVQVIAPPEVHGYVKASDVEITNDTPLARAAEIAAAQKWVETMRAEALTKETERRAELARKEKAESEERDQMKKEVEARKVCNQGLDLLRDMPDAEQRAKAAVFFDEAQRLAMDLQPKHSEAVLADVKHGRELMDTIAFHEREKKEAQEKLAADAAEAKRRADEAIQRADESLARHMDPKPVDAFGSRFAGNGLGMGWLRRELELPRGWVYKVEKGGKLLFYVTCPSGKYNLDDYLAREIGIIGTVKQVDGYPVRVVEVERIEVLSN
jgi:hypothetical protein